MIEIYGSLFYINFDKLDEFVASEKEIQYQTDRQVYDVDTKTMRNEEITKTTESSKDEINPVRYEIIRNLIDDLITGSSESDYDEKLASKNLEKTDIKFKLAFNTLSFYKILQKID